jgi:hypothetical protein
MLAESEAPILNRASGIFCTGNGAEPRTGVFRLLIGEKPLGDPLRHLGASGKML